MNNHMKIAGIALAMTLAACGGESTANGGTEASVSAEDVDTSRNWVEVVSKTDEGGFRMGNPDAPIEVVEYASLTCSHCATFAEESFEPLTRDYVSQGLVSFEVRNFVRDPLDLSAALLSRCNGAEPFFTLNERLFANQVQMFEAIQGADQARLQQVSQLPPAQAIPAFADAAGLIDFVGGLGISADRARQCLADPAAVQELEQMRTQALNQYNLAGTPTFVINGEVVQGVANWAGLEARLQQMVE